MNKIISFLIVLVLCAYVYAYPVFGADEPIVIGFTYTDTEAVVSYSDNTVKKHTAAEMGERAYDIYTKNLSLPPGSVPITEKRRWLVFRAKASNGATVDVNLINVEPSADVEGVEVDVEVSP